MKKGVVISLIIPSVIVSLLLAGGVRAEAPTFQDMAKKLNFKSSPPVTIYTAKEIITMAPSKPEAEAVAVVGDRILAVGSIKDLKEAAAGQPYAVDSTFADKILVPGFISQHLHPFLSSTCLTSEIISIEDWVLPSGTVPAVRDRDGYLKRLRAAEAGLKDPDELLLTWGFHHYFHGKLTREDLDKISSTRPIIVWHRSCHEFILNSAALEKYGLTGDFMAQQDKSAQEQSNLDEGHFWEQGAMAALPKLGGVIASPERMKKGLEFTENYLHAKGVTLASEPGGFLSKPLQDMENAVLGDEDTPFRFYFIPDGKSLSDLYLDGDLIGETEKILEWGEGMTSFLPRQIKLFADGAIYSQAMQMQDGYLDGHKGEWMMDLDLFAKTFRKYWDAGYQIVIHQNGDAGLEMVLTNLEANMRRNPRYDHRTTAVHFGFSTPEQVRRIKRLGGIVSANPYYVMALADKYSEAGIGPERANEMVRLGDVERAEIPFSLHSDMPMAPADPLFLMDCAVNRKTFSDRVAGPEQRVSREGALKAVTSGAAYSLRLEDEVGSIEPGKLANFTVLEENPLTVPAEKIKDIKVWGTVHEGRVLPVEKKKEAKDVSRLMPMKQISPPDTGAEAQVDHNHAHHPGCTCSLNRMLASAFIRANYQN